MDRHISKKCPQTVSAPKRAIKVSLDKDLLTEARELRINISQAAEIGLIQAVNEVKAERWLLDNEVALESSNDYLEKNGLPFAKYRQF